MKPYLFIIGIFLIVAVVLTEMCHIQNDALNNKQPTAATNAIDTASFHPIIEHSRIPNDSMEIHEEMHSDIVNEFTPVFALFRSNDRSTSCDSLKKLNDSLLTRLLIEKYKLERVKYYLKICKRHPTQTKFLVSWIDRAVQ